MRKNRKNVRLNKAVSIGLHHIAHVYNPTAQSLVLVIALLVADGFASAAIRDIKISTPRSFGYVIGDVIEHHVHFELERGYTLEEDLLPKAERVNNWLELRKPDIQITRSLASDIYDMTLRYQVINVPSKRARVFTPSHTLTFTNHVRSVPVLIPEWQFTVIPITQPLNAAKVDFGDLQPAHLPFKIPLSFHMTVFWLAGLGVMLIALSLAYMYWAIPFIKRTRRPFARAYSRLRKYAHGNQRYHEALRCVHNAFNHTAGKVLFKHHLEDFFADHPRYLRLRKEIDVLFSQSESLFYDDANQSDIKSESFSWLITLCRECRDIERGLA